MPNSKLFVGGLETSTTSEGLMHHFSKFGDLQDCCVMSGKYSKRSRGFGFVTFRDQSNVDRVLNTIHIIDNKEVEVKLAVPRSNDNAVEEATEMKDSPAGSPQKLFVGGLHPDVTSGDLRVYFDQFGPVADCIVIYRKDNMKPRGFGFVSFESNDSMIRALSCHQHFIAGRPVELKRATPKQRKPSKVSSVGSSPASSAVSSPSSPVLPYPNFSPLPLSAMPHVPVQWVSAFWPQPTAFPVMVPVSTPILSTVGTSLSPLLTTGWSPLMTDDFSRSFGYFSAL
eukprot:GILI01018168.1.p1 GENE.GILI01018168.1~~GILI01018168.1.p1  ORF type:complete len:283 (+),score=46.18 GILI01018168.1:105-953(+)